jgi:dyslexia susceptibility 1 candidate gene 1 protein
MPVKPAFEWEQTATTVVLRVTIKGFKPDAVDVFISDVFVKVNASPTYLLQLDLAHPIVVEKSSFWCDMPTVKITMQKAALSPAEQAMLGDRGEWPTLLIDKNTDQAVVADRRAGALERAEQLYGAKLDSREKQKAVEKKRMFEEHWAIEKTQRADIEGRVAAERTEEKASLRAWEETVAQTETARKQIFSPADVGMNDVAVPVRQEETTNVSIDFTSGSLAMPVRTRGDEDYYRKSRYKPVTAEDAPMFWKDKADKLYRGRQWRKSADAYSESIKRDGSFLTCISSRAACYLHLHEYHAAVNDCDLAITLMSNTPASDTTQDRYKATLMKLHVRRGAAYAWSGNVGKALEDYRMAAAYRSEDDDAEILRDLDAIEIYMREHAIVEQRNPEDDKRSQANRLYMGGNYGAAVEVYAELLAKNEYDVKSRSNMSAAYLHMGMFQQAFEQSTKVIDFCEEVASALNEPGVQSGSLMDSDDEEEAEDDFVAQRQEAARTIRERSGHVYLLLKCYVRCGAALCGLKRLKDGYDYFAMAVKITPYDDDLRDDANRIMEKLRMDSVISATTSAQSQ